MENNGAPQEILIIRRGGGDDGAAVKGGAWKIAYADFVTAMMAFFLVMWLINSANEATRARVASYFNPIKMTDVSPSGKGLRAPISEKASTARSKSETETTVHLQSGGNKQTEEQGHEAAVQQEADIMNNPFETLDELADKANELEGGYAALSSEKVGDPFDPQAWQLLRRGEGKVMQSPAGKALAPPGTQEADKGDDATKAAAPAVAAHGAGPQQAVAAPSPLEQKLASLAAQILDEQKTKGTETRIKLAVTKNQEGLLITVEDAGEKGMFEIGSAKPTAQLVSVVSQIGTLLGGEAGRVIIRGHTDARRFRSGRYDNWQLSTARAHMASYMLFRGGFQQSRVVRIEGYGASSLLVPADPFADANRRVEFLLAN